MRYIIPLFIFIGVNANDLEVAYEFMLNKQFEQAESLYLEVLEHNLATDYSQIYNNLGYIATRNGSYKQALVCYDSALAYGVNNLDSARIYHNLGRVAVRLHDLYSAKVNYVYALQIIKNSDENEKSNILNSLGRLEMLFGNYIEAIQRINQSLKLSQARHGYNYQNLANCFYYLNDERAVKYIDLAIKHSDTTRYSNLFYDKAKITNDTSYYWKALRSETNIVDRIKALNALGRYKEAYCWSKDFGGYLELRSLAGFADSIHHYDKCYDLISEMKSGFQEVESKLYLSANENILYKQGMDLAYSLGRYDKVFEYSERSKATLMKADSSIVSLKEVKRKSPFLVEYSYFDSVMYIIKVGRKVEVERKSTDELMKNYNLLLQSLNEEYYMKDFNSNVKDLKTSCSNLYDILLESHEKKMFVVPDGPISYIPFDILLIDTLGEFPDLPYLIKESNISYGFSATTLLSKKRPDNQKTIGIAPSSELISAAKEIEMFSEKHTSINKQKFFEVIQKGNVHFAGHFFPPYLYLTKDSVSLQEIEQVDIKANIVFLNACFSGLGEIRKGEGNISLARSFKIAGANQVIQSLWPVTDNVGLEIAKEFYEGQKDAASNLRASKLNWLQTCKGHLSHPLYWGTYTIYGSSKKDLTLIFGIPIIVFALVLYARFRRKVYKVR